MSIHNDISSNSVIPTAPICRKNREIPGHSAEVSQVFPRGFGDCHLPHNKRPPAWMESHVKLYVFHVFPPFRYNNYSCGIPNRSLELLLHIQFEIKSQITIAYCHLSIWQSFLLGVWLGKVWTWNLKKSTKILQRHTDDCHQNLKSMLASGTPLSIIRQFWPRTFLRSQGGCSKCFPSLFSICSSDFQRIFDHQRKCCSLFAHKKGLQKKTFKIW